MRQIYEAYLIYGQACPVKYKLDLLIPLSVVIFIKIINNLKTLEYFPRKMQKEFSEDSLSAPFCLLTYIFFFLSFFCCKSNRNLFRFVELTLFTFGNIDRRQTFVMCRHYAHCYAQCIWWGAAPPPFFWELEVTPLPQSNGKRSRLLRAPLLPLSLFAPLPLLSCHTVYLILFLFEKCLPLLYRQL